MITRRRALFAASAAAALILSSVATASAVTTLADPGDVGPLGVAVVGESTTLTGIEVSGRAITWGSETQIAEGSPSAIEARAFTPDLGMSPLTLGEMVVPPIPDALYAAATEDWAVGFDPYVDGLEGYGLWIRPAGGAAELLDIPADFGPDSGSTAIWGDTALVGNVLINLNTREIIVPGLGFESCLDTDGAVLADGVLLAYDTCQSTVVAVDVPADGITVAALEDPRVVIDDGAGLLALSRGLVVWGAYDDELGTLVVRWQRLTDEVGGYRQVSLPEEELQAIRVHGERFVLVFSDEGGLRVDVFETPTAEEGPLGTFVAEIGDLRRAVVSPMLESTLDPSSGMSLDYVPIDLFGRTLAWQDGDTILTATLPVLSGGGATMGAPSTGTIGATVTVTGAGYLPGEEVAVWLTSDPVLLATGYAAADGTFSATVTLPVGTVAGAHTLTLVGVESGWTAAAAITLAAAGNPGLLVDTGR